MVIEADGNDAIVKGFGQGGGQVIGCCFLTDEFAGGHVSGCGIGPPGLFSIGPAGVTTLFYNAAASGFKDHGFAFKMVLSDQLAEAKVVNVLWSPSKDGYLKPRIQIEPVVLGGAKIEYATAFNAAFVEDNKLGIGALVKLVRSGDVIPHIMAVVEPADKAKMPDDFR